jgi:hypothetical protein
LHYALTSLCLILCIVSVDKTPIYVCFDLKLSIDVVLGWSRSVVAGIGTGCHGGQPISAKTMSKICAWLSKMLSENENLNRQSNAGPEMLLKSEKRCARRLSKTSGMLDGLQHSPAQAVSRCPKRQKCNLLRRCLTSHRKRDAKTSCTRYDPKWFCCSAARLRRSCTGGVQNEGSWSDRGLSTLFN